MKVILDTEQCKIANVKISVVLYILALYFNEFINNDTFETVCSNGYIEYDGFDNKRQPINPKLTQAGIDLAESLLLNSEFRESNEKIDRYDILADKLRELYPKGCKQSKNGQSYPWRGSTAMIAKKLKALVKRTGVFFTDEQAIEATKRYIASFNGDYTYMRVLSYFISKLDPKYDSDGKLVREETSDLLNFIANLEDNNCISYNNDNGELV